MTIQEVERRCGMDRANIRFYEKEGLLTARRQENGYRDYSEENVQTLLRIRLLRSLRLSLDQIRAIQAGDLPLSQALSGQSQVLARESQLAAHAGSVCREICEANETFATLDADRYLDKLLSSPALPGAAAKALPKVPETDAVPPLRSPGRRYFARVLDLNLYSLLVYGLLALVGVNLLRLGTAANLLTTLFGMLLCLVLEPLWLSLFGTTPGKAILGLHIETWDGEKPTYSEARERTWQVLWKGYGLGIPVYCLVRLIKSYSACDRGDGLDWEYGGSGCVQTLRDTRVWRTVAWVAVSAGVFFGIVALLLSQLLPPNRGPLTPEEFVENFYYYADFYDLSFADRTLQPDGTWAETPEPGVGYVTFGGPPPSYHIETEEGFVTAVSFVLEPGDEDNVIYAPKNQMLMIALALGGAEAPLFSNFQGELADLPDMTAAETTDTWPQGTQVVGFDYTAAGLRQVCTVAQKGYMAGNGWDLFIVQDEDAPAETSFLRLEFRAEYKK